MKLATLKDGTRDGQLLVVSRDLKNAVKAHQVKTLQQALDNWGNIAPELEALSQKLNSGACQDSFTFNATQVHAPLPRAYQWADASAYVNHVELVRKSRGVEMPENFWTDPLMYQGGSDSFLGPCDDIPVQDEAFGIDYEAEIAVIVNDVPMAATTAITQKAIALIMLVNDVSLRNLVANELTKGFGFFNSKPSSSFSPVAVTPDELGAAWDGKKLHLPLHSFVNGERFGSPNAGVDMTFDFPTLIAHAAKTRPLSAGTIIGSGTVSNTDRSRGSSCLVERRMLEVQEKGAAKTPFLKYGDLVRIEMLDADNVSLFGAIEQTITPYR